MSLSFPLALAEWQDLLRQEEITFGPDRPEAVQELAGGDSISARLGPTRWQGTLTLAPALHRDSAVVEARLALLVDQGGSFLLSDPRFAGPAAGLGAGTPTVASISSDRREIALAGYTGTITAGDLLSWTYGSNPVRWTLHRAVTGAVNGGAFEVTPAVPFGAVTGATVALQRPVCRARLVAGSVSFGAGRRVRTGGIMMAWRQMVVR